MLASRSSLRLLAARLESSLCVSQSCSFSAAAEPATDHQPELQSRWDNNHAAMLYAPKDLRYEPHALPQSIAPDSVRVKLRAVGICGSDVHYYAKGRIGKNIVDKPMVLGHESAGDVVAVGKNVTSLIPGDRVAMEPGVPCWGNMLPRMGRYNLCPDIRFFATPPIHGSLADFIDHPADFCFKLPDNVSHEDGAMAEPLSNGITACRRGQVGPGKKVAILGAGPMGLNAAVAAKAFAASRVAITDIRADNFAVAEKVGVSSALLTPPSLSPVRIAEELFKLLPPNGPDVVIDCAGFDSTLQTAMEAVASGGKVVVVGMGQSRCTLDTDHLITKELDVHGCYRYTNTYPLCMELMTNGQIDLAPMISHRFPFTAQGMSEGFECARNADQTKAIKVMFQIPE